MKVKKFLALLLAATMIFVMTACQKTDAPKDAADKPQQSTDKPAEDAQKPAEGEDKPQENYEKADVRVAYMANMGSASSLVAAKEYGYFDKYGLNVELFKFSNGPDEISAMASGDIDISQIGHGAHKLCIQDKAVIFQMDATSLADMVMGNVERGVKTLQDLKGKRIASTLGTSADIILKLALEDAGLTEADVEIVEMDPNGVVPAMVSGQIDACATWSPGTETIKEKMGDKVVVLADNSTYLDKATFPSSFITSKDYAGAHKDILVRFAAAIQEAQDDRNSDKLDDIAKKVAKLTEIDENVMLVSKNEGNWTTSGAKFFEKALKDGTVKSFYETQQKLFLDAGAIDKEVPVENYVMFDVMEEANALATSK